MLLVFGLVVVVLFEGGGVVTNISFLNMISMLLTSFNLKEYYEIVGESRPLSAFFPKHVDFFTEMHF